MSKSPDRSLNEVLQSTSDCLFPENLGKQTVDIGSTDVDGDTPLHVLLWRKDTDGALLLIQHGANVNAVGDMGETPLHVAIRQENIIAIQTMLAVGARSDIVSESGQSPRDLAKEKGIHREGPPIGGLSCLTLGVKIVPMTKRPRIFFWFGAVFALFAMFYAFGSFIFYAWMNANGSWSAERAAAWAYPSLALAVIFLGLFVWCVWRLARGQSAKSPNPAFERDA